MPKKVYTERSRSGFTLVELLVVLTIISIMSIVVFVNFRTFSQDQVLVKAIGQVQTTLRLAQSNATSGYLCAGKGGAAWSVQFSNTDQSRIDLNCDKSTLSIKSYPLENAKVSSVTGSACLSAPTYPGTTSLIISYAPLSGSVTFSGVADCISTSNQSVTITLTNLKDSTSTRSFTISKGGAIDVK